MKRELFYFGIPALLFLSVLVTNHCLEDWEEFPQYMLLCGTIFAGFVAVYVSKISEARDKKLKQDNRKVQFQNIQVMLSQGLSELSNQIRNYNKTNKKVKEYPFKDEPFQLGSIYFLSEIAIWDKEKVYDYFIHSNLGNTKEKQEKYINLIRNVNETKFVYDLFENNMLEYVRNHNTQSRALQEVDQTFQNLFMDIFESYKNGSKWEITYLYKIKHDIVDNYNAHRRSTIEYQYSLEFYKKELIDRIEKFIRENPNDQFSPDLKNVYLKYSSIIDKEQENVNNFSSTIEECIGQLEGIKANLDKIFSM